MTPGQAAYEKWSELLTLRPPLEWESLPITAKEGWEEIAKAAISVKNDDPERLW